MYKVTNRNDFAFTGRYDGKDYDFPKGDPVIVPVDAAVHIFGMQETNKAIIYARHGWALPGKGTMADGKAILDNFAFEAVDFALPAPLAERGPAPALQEAGGEGDVSDGADSKLPANRGGKPGARAAAPSGGHARFMPA